MPLSTAISCIFQFFILGASSSAPKNPAIVRPMLMPMDLRKSIIVNLRLVCCSSRRARCSPCRTAHPSRGSYARLLAEASTRRAGSRYVALHPRGCRRNKRHLFHPAALRSLAALVAR